MWNSLSTVTSKIFSGGKGMWLLCITINLGGFVKEHDILSGTLSWANFKTGFELVNVVLKVLEK